MYILRALMDRLDVGGSWLKSKYQNSFRNDCPGPAQALEKYSLQRKVGRMVCRTGDGIPASLSSSLLVALGPQRSQSEEASLNLPQRLWAEY